MSKPEYFNCSNNEFWTRPILNDLEERQVKLILKNILSMISWICGAENTQDKHFGLTTYSKLNIIIRIGNTGKPIKMIFHDFFMTSANSRKSNSFIFGNYLIELNSGNSCLFSLGHLTRKIFVVFLYNVPFTVDASNRTAIRIAHQITRSHGIHWIWATSFEK